MPTNHGLIQTHPEPGKATGSVKRLTGMVIHYQSIVALSSLKGLCRQTTGEG